MHITICHNVNCLRFVNLRGLQIRYAISKSRMRSLEIFMRQTADRFQMPAHIWNVA